LLILIHSDVARFSCLGGSEHEDNKAVEMGRVVAAFAIWIEIQLQFRMIRFDFSALVCCAKNLRFDDYDLFEFNFFTKC